MIPRALLFFCLLLATSASPVRRDTEPAKVAPAKKKDLDIYSFHIKSTVSSRYAMTVITSRVANRANVSQEVVFKVELPKNAFISKFNMNIEGRVYDGVVKKKEVAVTEYTAAVSRGQSAGIVSAVGRTLEEFQTSVAVAAHSKVTFELTYEQLLQRKHGQYELLIKAHPRQVVKDFKIEVRVSEQQGIAFLNTKGSLLSEGRGSALNTTVSEKEALLKYTPSQEQQQCSSCEDPGLNGDLLLIYDVNRAQSKGEIQVSQGYFVHYFAPAGLQRIPKNVVFIIDQSGSMHGRKMVQTREALLKILEDIPEEDHFGLITFDNQVFPWKNDLVPANSDYLSPARTFVKNIRDRGSTDINAAVLEGVKMLNRFEKTQDAASILILLTDGDPTSGVTDLKQIQANVKEAIGKKYTLYCLGFGFDVNYEFLEKMALENDGVARRIYSDSDAALQLQGFYEEVATPLLLNVQLNYSGVTNLTQTRFAQYYNGSEIVVSGQITDNDVEALTAEIKANTKGDSVVFRTTLKEQKAVPENKDDYIFATYIQRLWAYLTLQQCMAKALLLSGEEKSQMDKQVLALALKYSFVTPLTSMVVTKPEGERQVAHKPKEGEKREDEGHYLMPSPPMGYPGVGYKQMSPQAADYGSLPMAPPAMGYGGHMGPPGPPMAHPGSLHPLSLPGLHTSSARVIAMSPPVFNTYADYEDLQDYSYGSRLLPKGSSPRVPVSAGSSPRVPVSAGRLPPKVFATHLPPTTVALTGSPVSHQKFRFLLPALSIKPLPPRPEIICFDIEGTGIFRLMEYKPADLIVKGQARGGGQAGFSAISIHMGQARPMRVNATTITFGVDQYSWSQANYTIFNKDSVWIHLTDNKLDMRWGEVLIKILLHQDGGGYFLWPDITGSSHPFTGLIGWLGGGMVLNQLPTAQLAIKGTVVPTSRDTTVDYRVLSKPTVDCWLFQYKSILQGNLPHLMLPTL
ncbi:inter-alpha-trypsin inhibitor heavy chain H3-like isoform X4 [Conger conger]|uniref:inter-alpha-trypsin inhibitor heavy chain H3-like isoform X4 n=1 Tax=Conger conger TaxID=82655 RepID=UPI002A5A32F8|nr:inter-alpha-trypsin inhibitor heavy chain H3-like isoform X4 [Conger conger]